MIDFIEGEIVAKGLGRLVLRTGDIGFDMKASNQTLSVLPPPGSRAMLYASLQLREDDISIYGFATKEERSFFDLLIQVSGIGPKLALSILSAYPTATIKKALVLGDLGVLTSISGIGKKTAQRMIVELKDKLDKELPIGGAADGFDDAIGSSSESEIGQAIEALEALGYSRPEVMRAFAGADISGMDVEALIKHGLKQLASYK
jgi:Holliday junction DNA helicase RuvA